MAVSPTPPPITLLPSPPLPTDPEAVFDTKAGVSLTAQVAMVPEINTALAWVAGALVDTKGYKDAAATSAGNAADSATLAGQKVGLATDQVALATTQANNAAASANSAQVSSAAAGAAAGQPSLVGNAGKVLTVNAGATGVLWLDGLPSVAGNAGKFLQVNSAGSGAAWVPLGVLIAVDERTSGTSPDAGTAGSYSTRVLNTVRANTIAGASLSSNTIILPAGTYNIQASSPYSSGNSNKARLYNVTASAVISIGQSGYSDSSAPVCSSDISCQITVGVTTTIRLEHRQQTASPMGRPVTFGDVEVYSSVVIQKVA